MILSAESLAISRDWSLAQGGGLCKLALDAAPSRGAGPAAPRRRPSAAAPCQGQAQLLAHLSLKYAPETPWQGACIHPLHDEADPAASEDPTVRLADH